MVVTGAGMGDGGEAHTARVDRGSESVFRSLGFKDRGVWRVGPLADVSALG